MCKWVLFAGICLLPLSAKCATLADCDNMTYDVIVNNGGMVSKHTVSPMGGVLEEYGPLVSFQIPGQPAMQSTYYDEEFCIWKGGIKVQRLNTIGDSASGRR